MDPAQTILVEQAAQREEVVVPTTVLEHGEQHPRGLGSFDKPAPVGGGRGQRLVDHHSHARLDAAQGQRHMRIVRRGHYHQVQLVRAGEDGVSLRDHLGVGMVLPGLGRPTRIGGDDRGHLESGRGGDERGVEHPSGQAVTDDAHPAGPELRHRPH